jgi:hypothetical protein
VPIAPDFQMELDFIFIFSVKVQLRIISSGPQGYELRDSCFLAKISIHHREHRGHRCILGVFYLVAEKFEWTPDEQHIKEITKIYSKEG